MRFLVALCPNPNNHRRRGVQLAKDVVDAHPSMTVSEVLAFVGEADVNFGDSGPREQPQWYVLEGQAVKASQLVAVEVVLLDTARVWFAASRCSTESQRFTFTKGKAIRCPWTFPFQRVVSSAKCRDVNSVPVPERTMRPPESRITQVMVAVAC